MTDEKQMSADNSFPPLLRLILRTFCHVEWYEVHELAAIAKSPDVDFDVAQFKRELMQAMESPRISVEEIHKLTSEEFETEDEARQWLKSVYDKVFGTPRRTK